MSGIVVGADDSAQAAGALVWALREGVRRSLPVTAVRAWSVPLHPAGASALLEPATWWEQTAQDALHASVASALDDLPERAQLKVRHVTRQGPAGPALVELAHDADLLVVGGPGRAGVAHALLGSTASYCLHHAAAPVVVVPGGTPVTGARRVVVGLDGSAGSLLALRWAADEAALRGVPLLAVRAWLLTSVPHPRPDDPTPVPPLAEWQRSALEQLQGWVRDALGSRPGLQTLCEARHGTPASVLLDVAERDDLLVIGSRGLGGFRSLLLGSVGRQCTEHADCPVVVVRTPIEA